MRKSLLSISVSFMLLVLFTIPAMASPAPPAVDSTPEMAVIVNIDEWSDNHPLNPGQQSLIGRLSTSPRYAVSLRSSNGLILVPHFHPNADEILVVYKGSCDMIINGTRLRVKAGDVHVNPRGVVHATYCAPGEEMTVVSIFTPARNESVIVE